jgi:hypothetical protein
VRTLIVSLTVLFAVGVQAPVFAQAAASSATSQRMAVPRALHNDVQALPASAGADTNLNDAASRQPLPASDHTAVTRRVRQANEHSLDASGHKVDAAGNPVGQAAGETDAESQ